MNEQQDQERSDEAIEDLDVPEETAEEIGGGRNPSPDPIPIPYPDN